MSANSPPLSTPVQGLSQALARLAIQRDREAWASVIEQIGNDIWHLVVHMGCDRVLAEDVVQETLLQVRDHADRFRVRSDQPDRDARRWIMSVGANTYLMLLRGRRRSQARDDRAAQDLLDSRQGQPNPDEQVSQRELVALVGREMAKLPDPYRQVLALHFLADLDLDAVAEQLAIPVSSAKTRLYRGLDRLRGRLNQAGIGLSLAALTGTLQGLNAGEVATMPASVAVECQQLLGLARAPRVDAMASGLGLTAKTGIALAAAAVMGVGLTIFFEPATPIAVPVSMPAAPVPTPASVAQLGTPVELPPTTMPSQTGFPNRRTYVYKIAEDHPLEVQVYATVLPAAARPALIFFPGRGAQKSEVGDFAYASAYFASRGLIAITADYRMIPFAMQPFGKSEQDMGGTSPFRVGVSDVKSAIRWVKQHALELGVDPQRVIIGGGGQGATCAMLATVNPGLDDPMDPLDIDIRVAANVLLNPVFQLKTSVENRDAAMDVLSFIHASFPPAIHVFGSDDVRRKGSEALFERLTAKRTAAMELWVAPGQKHNFYYEPAWHDVTLIEVDRFLTRCGFLAGEPTLNPDREGKKLIRVSLPHALEF